MEKAAKAEERARTLEEENARAVRTRDDAVQESVAMRMQMRKNEEQLSAKMAEAAAEANRAAEASRLLEALRRKHRETALKGTVPPRSILRLGCLQGEPLSCCCAIAVNDCHIPLPIDPACCASQGTG